MTYGSGGPGNLIFPRLLDPRHRLAEEAFSAPSVLAEFCHALGGPYALAQSGGRDFASEWTSLGQEQNPEIFWEGFLSLAQRQERSGNLELAGRLYAFAVERSGQSPLRRRAQTRVDAMLGQGDAWTRAEFMGRRLAAEACDPAVLAAMGIAGVAFRATRLATLSQLAASPAENILTRGLGGRWLASGVGLLAEAPTFTLAHRGADALMGRSVDLNPNALLRDFGSGAMTLLSLRLMGGLSSIALRRWAVGNGMGAAALRQLLPQVAMFGGLLLSQRGEEALGLRQARQGATTYTDALASLLSFHVGGRLSHHAFGESFAAQERMLETRGEILGALNAPAPSTEGSEARRSPRAWAPTLAAMGLGLHTFLLPGQAWAQDHSLFGGMSIFDPTILGGLLTVVGGGMAYGLKRIYDHYWGTPKENPQYFSRHRNSILSGLGGETPNDRALPGEEALIAERLAFQHEDTLYHSVTLEQMMAVIMGNSSHGQGAFRENVLFSARRAGPRVFDVGFDLADHKVTRILELTHPLPQTPPPEKIHEDEGLFRVAHALDLQHHADSIQKPLLAIPVLPGSEYHLAIPLHHASAGYVLPTFVRGLRGITTEQFRGLGDFGGVLDGSLAEQAPIRPFLIENNGSGYLLMDWQCAHVEVAPKSLLEEARAGGVRVNGESLRGSRSSHPLNNGDRIRVGDMDLLWISPRPGRRVALIRSLPPQERNRERSAPVLPGLDRLGQRSAEITARESLPRMTLPPELLERYQTIVTPALLRLPELVFETGDGTRILLSPRLQGDSKIPVGINPGMGGIYLHGAWNPRARRYAVAGAGTEFFLRQFGEAYFLEAPKNSTVGNLRLARPNPSGILRDIPLRPGEEVELQDGDVIEFGPQSQRSRLTWYRNLDAERGP